MFRETHVTIVAVFLSTQCSVATYVLLGMSWYRHSVTNPTTRCGGGIGFVGARKSRGHSQTVSVHSEILNASV